MLYIILNSKDYLGNINGTLTLNVNNLKNSIINNGKINISIKEEVIKLESSLFEIEGIGKIKSDFRYYEKEGDLIFVSDLLGKGKKGLIDYRNNRDSDTNHYLKPQLPISLIPKLKQLVTSCIDVSDGLLIDLKRICSSSNVGAVINSRKDIYITDEHDLIAGDDYVLCFTAKKELKEKILALDSSIKIIGQIEEGTKVKVLNENNTEIKYKKDGWDPFESI